MFKCCHMVSAIPQIYLTSMCGRVQFHGSISNYQTGLCKTDITELFKKPVHPDFCIPYCFTDLGCPGKHGQLVLTPVLCSKAIRTFPPTQASSVPPKCFPGGFGISIPIHFNPHLIDTSRCQSRKLQNMNCFQNVNPESWASSSIAKLPAIRSTLPAPTHPHFIPRNVPPVLTKAY